MQTTEHPPRTSKQLTQAALLGLCLTLALVPDSAEATGKISAWLEKLLPAGVAKPNQPSVAAQALLQAQLQAVSAADYGLPAHWRAFHLQEPVFASRILLAETGPPEAPVLLLIHGLGQNGLRDWLPLVPALAQQFRLVMLDLPGFAASQASELKLTPTRYAQLLHGLKPLLSERPITVLGHSMGAAVALRYAASFPADVEQLLLIDAAGILQRTAFVKHSLMDRLPITEMLPSALLAYAVSLHNGSSSLVEKLAGLPDPSAWLAKSDTAWGLAFGKAPNVNAALGLVNEDFSSAIYELVQPVAMLWGGQDMVAPFRTAQVLLAGLPTATLTVIPEAGHVPMSSHPEQLGAWVLEALARTAGVPDPAAQKRTIDAAPAEPVAMQEHRCEAQIGGRLSGQFDRLLIRDCRGLKLEHLQARQLEIVNSVVSLHGVRISGAAASLRVSRSSMVATASEFAATITVDASRLDLAGVVLQGDAPFNVGEKSRLLLSVSRSLRSDGTQRYLHSDQILQKTMF